MVERIPVSREDSRSTALRRNCGQIPAEWSRAAITAEGINIPVRGIAKMLVMRK